MSLATGTRLGPYEIQSALGAGGMGEVYKARDTRLDRTVAIKVLPDTLAADPQFRERFDREARAISQLDHPHICALYDVGDQSGTAYLVMQYLEGETLAERVSKGMMPIAESLTIATEIVSALDAAHRRGITHRDLKPGNVMLTKAGVKVLDFGLAKQTLAGQSLSAGGAVGGASALPTQGAPLTLQGTILGTLQYMAPEQLEGNEADARTDLFAFGAVVYEMLTGKKAFEGKSQASLMAAILDRDPPAISSIQPLTPPALDRVVRKCLAKDPDDRWQSARDLFDELKWIDQSRTHPVSGSGEVVVAGAPGVTTASRRPRRERLTWASVVALVTLMAIVTSVLAFRPARVPPEMRLEIMTPPTTDPASLAISPDGQQIVFVASAEGQPRLWLRHLSVVSARPLAGTDDATYPFWSPDNRSIGFFAAGKLKRLDIAGGSVQTLANAPVTRGGTWGQNDTILFAPTSSGPLFRVPATGGEPIAVTRLTSKETNHRFPQFLPDGRHFLYYVLASPDVRGVYIGQLDGSETRRLFDADAAAWYVSSGYLLFVRQGTLFAQRFDGGSRVLSGTPVVLAEGVAMDVRSASLAALSASAAGSIVYRAGSAGGQRQFIWFDRSGKEIGRAGDPHDGFGSSLSPDGRRVALQRQVSGNPDVWVLELGRGVFSRFTSDTAVDNNPMWAPDGRTLVFSSNRKNVFDLYQKSASGSGLEELLLATGQIKNAVGWSPDGRFLLYRTIDPKTGYDLWALPMGDRKPFVVVQTEFEERDGQFSPDGQWIAYQTNESGRFEVYVQPFPGPGGKAQVSTAGGAQVRWRADGKELFYIAADSRLMAVPIRFDAVAKAVEPGTPVALFATHIGGAVQASYTQQYAVWPDGQRFLMNTVTDEATSPITVILNWKPDGATNRR